MATTMLVASAIPSFESVSRFTTEEGNENGAWAVNNSKQLNNVVQDTNHPPNLSDLNDIHKFKIEKDDSVSDTIEDEAWDLLRESIVTYCGSPIGTIAANDPTSSSVLNYDQVFIRDFIPSGIAFLLKGEYEIVRNFILHTLQLQVLIPFLCSSHNHAVFALNHKPKILVF